MAPDEFGVEGRKEWRCAWVSRRGEASIRGMQDGGIIQVYYFGAV